MTRVAKRSISGQQKKSLESTKWNDMKPQQEKNSDKADKSEGECAGNSETFKKRKKGNVTDGKAVEKAEKRKLCFRCGKRGHRKQDCRAENDSVTVKFRTAQNKERRSTWRREQRKTERDSKMSCYKCRQTGHKVSECPEITNDVEQGTGICFKCGSTEHSSKKCNLKIPPGEFPYAKCYVCGERGHLSRMCPHNPRGLYVDGGCCNQCGSVEHYKRDCPEFLKQKGIGDMKVGRLGEGRSADDEDIIPSASTETVRKKQTGPKVVKF